MFFEIEDFDGMRAAIRTLCNYLEERNVSKDVIFDSKLISSELVSNVLQHTDGKAYFEGNLSGDYVEIEVGSSVRFVPPQESRCAEVTAERGRGLFLVDCYCERRILTGAGGIKVFIRAVQESAK
ncbi:MAG: ATP-binding protein [Christensenellaceae bacterium]